MGKGWLAPAGNCRNSEHEAQATGWHFLSAEPMWEDKGPGLADWPLTPVQPLLQWVTAAFQPWKTETHGPLLCITTSADTICYFSTSSAMMEPPTAAWTPLGTAHFLNCLHISAHRMQEESQAMQ